MPDDRIITENIKSDNDVSNIKDTFTASTSPDELFDALISIMEKCYQVEELKKVEKAYNLANDAHKEQRRKSGEPYIVHPLCVAIILAKIDMDADTIVAGILHDIVEDTDMTKEGVAEIFGNDVAYLVEGVTKLTNFSWSADKTDKQAENLRKMFIAMARDIRVVVIKLADRLHNMRTLQYMKPEKQKEKARETRDIYAPIAQRLGISCIKVELEDLALKYLEPDVYNMIEEKLAATKKERGDFIRNICNEIKAHQMKDGITINSVEGCEKHYFSIYKKMVNMDMTLDQIYDVFAIRIIVDSEKDCYAALGVVHDLYKPVPGKFKDFISMPKENKYRSLHTTVVSNNGEIFDVQIRTGEMHRTAVYGITNHWRKRSCSQSEQSDKNTMIWLREILEIHNEMEDNHEFLNLVKNDLDLFTENVYCFTPSGEPKTLSSGSTIVDFAYSVHTAVGNKMIGAKVNGKLISIDYVIQNGDRIEILVSDKSQGPTKEWLSLAKSAQARSKIKQWFKVQNKEDNIIKGMKAIEDYCSEKNIDSSSILKPEYISNVVQKYRFADWESLLAAIGHGGMKESRIVSKLMEEVISNEVPDKIVNTKNRQSNNCIIVKEEPTADIRFSKCCNPVPGDEIIGFCTKGGVVSIHRKDCTNILNLNEAEQRQLVETEWLEAADINIDEKYIVGIDIYVTNHMEVVAEVSGVVAEMGIDILSLNGNNDKQRGIGILSLSFEIKDRAELDKLTNMIKKVPGVIDIQRTTIK